MRRRLVVLLLVLMGGVLAALSGPFLMRMAQSVQESMYVDRVQDTDRFAFAAEQATTPTDLEALHADLVRYQQVYGVTAAIVDRSGAVDAGLADVTELRHGANASTVALALAGHQSPDPGVIWPWEHQPMVVAVPIMRGGDVIGAAVTISPTNLLRDRIRGQLQLLAFADAGVLLLCVVAAYWLATWIVRPVYRLDRAIQGVGTGDLSTRVCASRGPVELRRLACSFNEMTAAVEHAMRRQQDFVADASHQLRNPLTALHLRLELLGQPADERVREVIDDVRTEAKRLSRVVDDLLDLAAAQYVAAYRVVAVDLTELVTARIKAWTPTARNSGVELDFRPRAVVARADPSLIGSALDAVLDNAIRFNSDGGCVCVELCADADRAVVLITDDGPGLAPEEFERIGDRFWRSPRNQNIAGSGLGLAIVRQLMDASGGRLHFEPVTPHGLRVIMTLPAAQDAPPTCQDKEPA
jgi:signal transduction histidine kinase